MGDTEAMWLGRSAIYFVKWKNFLKSLVKINTYAKISINDLLTYSNYGNIWYRLRIMQIDKDTLQGRRKQGGGGGGRGAAPPIFHKGGRDSFRPPPKKKYTAKFSKLEVFETVYIILIMYLQLFIVILITIFFVFCHWMFLVGGIFICSNNYHLTQSQTIM
jgi:hypothetical protein